MDLYRISKYLESTGGLRVSYLGILMFGFDRGFFFFCIQQQESGPSDAVVSSF